MVVVVVLFFWWWWSSSSSGFGGHPLLLVVVVVLFFWWWWSSHDLPHGPQGPLQDDHQEALVSPEDGDFSIKLEDQVLITENGFENLTKYPFDPALMGEG